MAIGYCHSPLATRHWPLATPSHLQTSPRIINAGRHFLVFLISEPMTGLRTTAQVTRARHGRKEDKARWGFCLPVHFGSRLNGVRELSEGLC